MDEPAKILLVEDVRSLARTYVEYLRDQPYDVTHVETGAAAIEAIRKEPPAAILLDLHLPDMDGMEIIKQCAEQEIPSQIVVITATGSLKIAVEAMRNGAADFLVKPFAADRLRATLANALERRRLERIVDTYREEFDRKTYCGYIGSSLAMQAVYRIIDAAAHSKATVLITGESGTGKELCAEAIHQMSPRGKNNLVPVNCAAIPKDLIESEMFGHTKGAFTGASAAREGAASLADGGTLFLDEIADMDVRLQAKLLRFLQTGSFQRVGSSATETVDVRFVCATNRDPLAEIKAGGFREDLYYRLNVIPIHLPPLREREGDVIEIAEHFLEKFAGEEHKQFRRFSPEVAETLRAYDWPGNVRELQNVVRNITVLNDGEEVTPEMLPQPLSQGAKAGAREGQIPEPEPRPAEAPISAATPAPPTPETGVQPLWKVEKAAIEAAIADCNGNVARAAASLGISPSTIYRKQAAWEKHEDG